MTDTHKMPDSLKLALVRRVGFEDLTVRNRDSLDFREISIVALTTLLDAAYEAGANARRTLEG